MTYQGCADAGLCYPQLVKVLNPDMTTVVAVQPTPAPAQIHDASRERVPPIAILAGLLAFFLAGLALRSRRSSVRS